MLSDLALSRARGTRATAAKIALKGGQRSLLTFEANWAPWCDSPVDVYRAVKPGTPGFRSVEASLKTPCRKCARCLQFRQMRWRARANEELRHALRTWMVTLTFSPPHLAGVLMEARSPDLADVEVAAYRHVQRYFKRLRKAKHRFRYLAIYERGETTGRSHYHVFIHEIGPKPIPKSEIEHWWRSNVHARLVSTEAGGAASYMTKYLTKALSVRPRASSRYGYERREK